MTRFPLLVLDHDDTAVRSTPDINYPSFLLTLEKIRPGIRPTLEEYVQRCCDFGFQRYCTEILGFSDEEMELEVEMWKSYTAERAPEFYAGIPGIVRRQRAEGGAVCVISQSSSHNIKRDYLRCCGLEPDLVFGWDCAEGPRKPDPWPLEQALLRLGFDREQALVVDDLPDGARMAESCGVAFACAGWSHAAPGVRAAMRELSEIYLERTEQLEWLLFGRDGA